MAARRTLWLLAGVVALGMSLTDVRPARADFNPFGRKQKPAAKPKQRSTPKRATTPRPAPSQKESKEALIARYSGIVMSRPGELFPLQRLAELYRERDGSLDALIAEFEKRASSDQGDRYNALVALAGIYKQDAQHARAVETLERAIAAKPQEPDALLALGHLLADRGDKAGARARFEQALPYIKNDSEREPVLRLLMTLCLDTSDYEAARKYHLQIVKRAGNSFFARAELGRELLLRGDYERAEREFRDVVRAATGDNRALAPALRDLGRALASQKKNKEALEVLERALRVAGDQSGLRREIFDIEVEVYRAGGSIVELLGRLEKEKPGDFERLVLLGGLYEETGQMDKALETYERALARRSNDISTRLKVVQLLEVQGRLEEAIGQYEALIRAAPRNPQFVFQLAEAFIQRGERAKALVHLRRLEGRSQGDEETMAALVDFYERVDEHDHARALLERLAASGQSTDPRHLVELGDRYFQEGNEKKALEIWARIPTVVPDKARAQQALGEVYLEHDMPEEALAAFRKAMEIAPDKRQYKKAYALALERSGAAASSTMKYQRYEEAIRIWEALLREGSEQSHLAREARQHIVTIWSLQKQLERRVRPLENRLAATPPSLEAGQLLGEVYVRLRQYPDAERTLRRVVEIAPGDIESHRQLERVLVLQRKLEGALVVLQKLVKLEPKRAREYYQRMAQYAAELYRDDDAIRYAEKAVELSPEDADGHKKLGEMYQRRQETDRAIVEFRKAIGKNDRLFPVYFELADLLLSRGDVDEADKLLRRVVRASPDEELVSRAARLSMQVNLGRGTLESLEKELLPVALGNPQKPIYRRLLVEIYGNLAFPLVHEAKSEDSQRAHAAREALRKIGERSVKPLLDALGDERDSQQRTAIELLSHTRNKSAGPALFNYALGEADAALRTRAMIAAGSLEDPELLPKFREVLIPDAATRADETDTVAVAAAWGVARLRSNKARPLLLELLDSDAPSIRALAAIGLGLLESRRDSARLGALVRASDAGSLVRAAAAFALGQLGDHDEEDALRALAESTDPSARGAAVVSLARLESTAAPHAIAEALVSSNETLRSAGVGAALVLATGEYRLPPDPLSIPDGRVDVTAIVRGLRPAGYGADARAAALSKLASEIARAAVAAAQSSPDGARLVENALLSTESPGFSPLTEGMKDASAAAKEQAAQAAEVIASSVAKPFLALAKHPSADVRVLAVRFLATRREPNARESVLAAISDPSTEVQRAALAAVVSNDAPEAIPVVTRLLNKSSDWAARVRAAETLGKLAEGKADPVAAKALAAVATTDPFALVRDAAVRALFATDPNGSRSILADVAARDLEPRVRRRAQELLRAGAR